MMSCTRGQKLISYFKLLAIYGLVVKGLSRLPVTEEIAGSNPVEPAKHKQYGNRDHDGLYFV
jgi:hypothetical protein